MLCASRVDFGFLDLLAKLCRLQFQHALGRGHEGKCDRSGLRRRWRGSVKDGGNRCSSGARFPRCDGLTGPNRNGCSEIRATSGILPTLGRGIGQRVRYPEVVRVEGVCRRPRRWTAQARLRAERHRRRLARMLHQGSR